MSADPGMRPTGSHDDYDALADLFLGMATLPKVKPMVERNAGRSESSRPASKGRDQIELLVLGHLPVMGSAWAAQFARHQVAAGGGPVALARLSSGHLRIDVFGARPGMAAPVGTGALGPTLDWLTRSGARVLMQAPMKEEVLLAGVKGVGGVTLLTSSDEAGIVAAYRTLKGLVRHGSAARGSEVEEGAAVTLGIAVMGVPADQARAAWHRLNRAAESFLGTSLAFAACLPQIRVEGAGISVYSGSFDGSARELLSMLAADAKARPALTVTLAELATHDDEVDGQPLFEPTLVGSGCGDDELASDGEAGPSGSVGTEAGVALCDHVPGLTMLDVRCPAVEEVELALDASGTIHALASTRADGRDQRLLERLHAAAAWAVLNRRLIERVQVPPALRIGTGTVLHVFTDRPAEYRGLLDSPVRVHLLAPVVRIANHGAWVAAALN